MQGDHRVNPLAGNMVPAAQYQQAMMALGGGGDFGSHSATALLLGQHNFPEDPFYQFQPPPQMQQYHQFNPQQYLDIGHHPLMNLQGHQVEMNHQLIPHPRHQVQEEDPDIPRSGSEIGDGLESADEQELEAEVERPGNKKRKRKKYNRHSQYQIQEMAAVFKINPHPDEKQRREIAARLVLSPLQVKFWFQNKRTQKKIQEERDEKERVRRENEALRHDNEVLKEALSCARCPNCRSPSAVGEVSFDGQHLIVENARLREEIEKLRSIASRYATLNQQIPPNMPQQPFQIPNHQRQPGGGVIDFGPLAPQNIFPADMIRAADGVAGNMMGNSTGGTEQRAYYPEVEKTMVFTLAVAGMDELSRLTDLGSPLWITDAAGECKLNEEEYQSMMFTRGIRPKPEGWKTEASRDSALVIMSPLTLVGIMMDVNKWSTMFAGIVSNAATVEVLSNAMAGNYNGVFQLMSAEFQVPSPLVPTRPCFFVRYSKLRDDGSWLVVDISLDSNRPGQDPKSLRLPSGCLIQDIGNGYSKVVWVEHSEVDDSSVHEIYKKLLSSGLAFGAKRWVAILDRQSARLASALANEVPPMDGAAAFPPEARRGVLKLAQRLVRGYYKSVRSSGTTEQWTGNGDGELDIKFITQKNANDPTDQGTTIVSAATSMWLPIPPKRVFDFLRDASSRSQWDVLSSSGMVQTMANLVNDGRQDGNCVTLLQVNDPQSNGNMILQETFTDATGSYVVYSPLDVSSLQRVIQGENTDSISLVGSGFGILPDGGLAQAVGEDGSVVLEGGRSGGTLLTIVFQILGYTTQFPHDKVVSNINELISCTVKRITGAASAPEGDDQ